MSCTSFIWFPSNTHCSLQIPPLLPHFKFTLAWRPPGAHPPTQPSPASHKTTKPPFRELAHLPHHQQMASAHSSMIVSGCTVLVMSDDDCDRGARCMWTLGTGQLTAWTGARPGLGWPGPGLHPHNPHNPHNTAWKGRTVGQEGHNPPTPDQHWVTREQA